jgi:hypothetical protein
MLQLDTTKPWGQAVNEAVGHEVFARGFNRYGLPVKGWSNPFVMAQGEEKSPKVTFRASVFRLPENFDETAGQVKVRLDGESVEEVTSVVELNLTPDSQQVLVESLLEKLIRKVLARDGIEWSPPTVSAEGRIIDPSREAVSQI